MDRKLLPIGEQSFRRIRERGCYYVDKTSYIDMLMREGAPNFFLSRPRRFGKSLFVDTLNEAFDGNKKLFEGLELYDKWDWTRQNPVIRLDFSGSDYSLEGKVESKLRLTFNLIEKRTGVTTEETEPEIRLHELIDALYTKTGQEVALLVDEYDKPILDALDNTDLAMANRKLLRGLYGVLKQTAGMVRFSFFTGVSKFSKVSLFSGVNNLFDMTLNPKYSAICGYTEQDIDTVFGREVEGLDRDEMRLWYNGYNWLGDENVYNPHAVLNLFETRTFKAHWYETGSSDFLISTLRKHKVYSVNIGKKSASEKLLSAFDVGQIDPLALLFQTGNLTITGTKTAGRSIKYKLDYPNYEVRQSLNQLLEYALFPDEFSPELDKRASDLEELMMEADVEGMEEHFKSLFAGIPHQWYDSSEIKWYEAHCASVFFSHLTGSGMDVRPEDSTNRGRVDLAVILENRVYVMEFKIAEKGKPGAALKQIRTKGYAEKYRRLGVPVTLLGVEFSSKERNIVGFHAEDA